MRKHFKSILSLVLLLSLVLGSMPAIFAADTTTTNESEIHLFMSTGDAIYVGDMASVETAKSLSELAKSYAALGITRIYWRGMQQKLWDEHDVNVEEALPTFNLSVKEQEARFEKEHGMSMDAYFVKEAHKYGMEVYGVSSLEDWGSAPDVPIYSWPTGHNADFRIENPDWVPKDKYGLIEQGGAINFSYPKARKYFVDMHMAEMEDAGYDGMMFVTYSENYSVMFGDQFGYDKMTVQAFKSRFGLDPTQEAFSMQASLYDWRRLRGEYVTELFREFDKALGDKKFAIWLDGGMPYFMNLWTQESYSNRNMIFLDLNTYIEEELFDTFIVRASSANRRTALGTIDDLYFLTRGYDIEIAVDTSSPYAKDWDEFRALGLDFMYNTGAFGEEYMYNGLNLPEDATEEDELNKWLGQIAMGATRANIPEVTKYLNNDTPYTTLRLAIKAITKLKPGNLADLLEPFLSHEETGIRSAAATSLRGVCDENTIDYLIDALDKHSEYTLRYGVQRALQASSNVYADQLLDLAENHKNPRVRAVAMYALANNSHNASFPKALDMFVDAVETEFAPAGADEMTANEYNSIRAYAVTCIGKIRNDDAIDALIEISENGDTVVNFRAAQSMGDLASYFMSKPARKQEVIDAIDALLEEMGDYSTRADRDWAYRPLSDALMSLGSDGKAVLQRNLTRTDDLQLALFAWKALYIPYQLSTWVTMNEQSYEEAYQMLPNVLKNFNNVVLEQNFDNTAIFDIEHKNMNQNGYIRSDVSGNIYNSWGVFSNSKPESNTQITKAEAHSGDQSVAMNADLIVTVGGGWSGTYEFSYWVKRTTNGSYLHNITDASRNPEVALNVSSDGKLTVADVDSDDYLDTGLVIPADKWVQVTVTADRANALLSFRITDEDGNIEYAENDFPFEVISGVDRILFRGRGIYLDDFYLALPTIEQYVRPVDLGIEKDDTASGTTTGKDTDKKEESSSDKVTVTETLISQNFDDTSVFDTTHKNMTNPNGYWSVYKNEKDRDTYAPFNSAHLENGGNVGKSNTRITTDEAHSGKQSVSIHNGSGELAVRYYNGQKFWTDDYRVSFWLYLDSKNAGSSAGTGTSFKVRGASNAEELGLNIANGGLIYFMKDDGSGWIDTGLKIPMDTWTKVTVTVEKSALEAYVSVTNEDGEETVSKDTYSFNSLEGGVNYIHFHGAKYIYIDDIVIETIEVN